MKTIPCGMKIIPYGIEITSYEMSSILQAFAPKRQEISPKPYKKREQTGIEGNKTRYAFTENQGRRPSP
jgi:hypothetical protein